VAPMCVDLAPAAGVMIRPIFMRAGVATLHVACGGTGVADLQAPEEVELGERLFDHPAVASQAVLGLDTTAGDAGDDVTGGVVWILASLNQWLEMAPTISAEVLQIVAR